MLNENAQIHKQFSSFFLLNKAFLKTRLMGLEMK